MYFVIFFMTARRKLFSYFKKNLKSVRCGMITIDYPHLLDGAFK
jgi:hypothetical protein